MSLNIPTFIPFNLEYKYFCNPCFALFISQDFVDSFAYLGYNISKFLNFFLIRKIPKGRMKMLKANKSIRSCNEDV